MTVGRAVDARDLAELEARLDSHDGELQELVEAIRELVAPLPPSHRRIGFEAPADSPTGRQVAGVQRS